uniref:RRM domain-containing protein n=1 Tax=Psilocybe cubensis TaxID=181762 RepID=A0A8H7XXZ1_PSICU
MHARSAVSSVSPGLAATYRRYVRDVEYRYFVQTLSSARACPATLATLLCYRHETRSLNDNLPSNARSYAFVEFKSNRDAEDAYYDMHGRYFEGSRLSIQWAKNPPSSVWRYERRSPPPSHRSGRDRSRSPRRRDDRDRDRDRLDDRDRDRDRRRRSRSPPPHLDRDRRRSPSPDRRRDARDRDRGDRDRGDRDRERERPKTPPAEEPVKKDEDRERERDRQDRGDNDQVRTPPYDH